MKFLLKLKNFLILICYCLIYTSKQEEIIFYQKVMYMEFTPASSTDPIKPAFHEIHQVQSNNPELLVDFNLFAWYDRRSSSDPNKDKNLPESQPSPREKDEGYLMNFRCIKLVSNTLAPNPIITLLSNFYNYQDGNDSFKEFKNFIPTVDGNLDVDYSAKFFLIWILKSEEIKEYSSTLPKAYYFKYNISIYYSKEVFVEHFNLGFLSEYDWLFCRHKDFNQIKCRNDKDNNFKTKYLSNADKVKNIFPAFETSREIISGITGF